jgi:hypothetical protein
MCTMCIRGISNESAERVGMDANVRVGPAGGETGQGAA